MKARVFAMGVAAVLFAVGCGGTSGRAVIEGAPFAGDLMFALAEPEFVEAGPATWTTDCTLLVKNTGSEPVELVLPRQNYNLLTLGSSSATTVLLDELRQPVPAGETIEVPLGTVGSMQRGDRIDLQLVVDRDGVLEVVTASSTLEEVVMGGGEGT